MTTTNITDEKSQILALEKENKELKERLEALTQISNNHKSFLGNSKDFIYFKNKQHQFTSVSQSFLELTGFDTLDEVIGKTDFDLFDKEHAEIYLKEQNLILNEGKIISGLEEPYYDNKGNLGWVSTSKWPIYDKNNEIVGLIGMSRDITHTKEMEDELIRQAHYDHLTQVYNREFFIRKTTEQLKQLDPEKQVAAMLFLDLDDFKQVNDSYGHEAGDHVLEVITQRVNELLRCNDIFGRIGGDEFAIFSIIRNQKDHTLIVDRIIQLFSTPIEWNKHTLQVGCSIGVSFFPNHGRYFDTLLNKADLAMYQAKSAGKNHYSLYHDAMPTELETRSS